MQNKNIDRFPIPQQGNKLNNIISAYGQIWADVLYHKNLKKQLKKIEFDIFIIDILLGFYVNNCADRFLKTRSDIIKLSGIVQRKLAGTRKDLN